MDILNHYRDNEEKQRKLQRKEPSSGQANDALGPYCGSEVDVNVSSHLDQHVQSDIVNAIVDNNKMVCRHNSTDSRETRSASLTCSINDIMFKNSRSCPRLAIDLTEIFMEERITMRL